MNRIIAAILLTLLGCEFAAAQAASLKITVPKIEGQAGAEVVIPLTLKDAAPVGALHLELVYDPAVLEYQSITKGPLFSGNAMLDSSSSAGRLIIGLVSLDPVQGDGVAANARFVVKGATGSTTALRLENLRGWENKTHADLLVQSEDGQFTSSGSPANASPPQLREMLPWMIASGAVILMLVVVVIARSRQSRR